MSTSTVSIYFESSWSILSSIGLVNVLIGFIVVGITGFTRIALVPMVCSASAAIADGLCFYAFYEIHSRRRLAAAGAVADIFWGIQEGGLSFYSYLILNRILHGRPSRVFISLYWFGIFVVGSMRISITVLRLQDTLGGDLKWLHTIDHLHIGYFTSIALVEMLSSYFLLQKFFSAKRGASDLNQHGGLFSYLMRSTEIRLAILTLIGITRAITYSFQESAQSATNLPGQVDRFVVVLEVMFPVVMYIDMISAKTFSLMKGDVRSPHNKSQSAANYGRSQIETQSDVDRGSSSMGIVEKKGKRPRSPNPQFHGAGSHKIIAEGDDGISKTVEFSFQESNSKEGDSPV